MEVKSQTIRAYHSKELEEPALEECFLTATLRVPQQESFIVTYLMPVMFYRASMWGYTLVPLVSFIFPTE